MIDIDDLKSYLSKRVRGQPKAIATLCDLIEDSQNLDKYEPRRGPIGVVMALGPSGVGKTESARALASYLHGSDGTLIHVSCGNYTQEHTVHTLIGAPPGYIGYDKAPLLSQEEIDKICSVSEVVEVSSNPELVQLQEEKRALSELLREYYEKLNRIGISWFNAHEAFKLLITSAESLTKSTQILAKIPKKTKKYTKTGLEALEELGNKIALAQVELYRLVQNHAETKAHLDDLTHQSYIIEDRITQLNVKSTPSGNKSEVGVILFDEIEKAHPTIHKFLLEAMENGWASLANNTRVNLSNCLFILTSNLGARAMGRELQQEGMGFRYRRPAEEDYTDQQSDSSDLKILAIAETEFKKEFSPEFRGRIDAVVVYRQLSQVTLTQILDDQIKTFAEALRLRANVELLVEDSVKQLILRVSRHRREVGARLLGHKLKSTVKRLVGRGLAKRPKYRGKVRVYLNKDIVSLDLSK